ncbi:threo-3-hydroxy-L-aspartate ammonia-lyase [Orrella daihaiensis]|uniref:Threo-3-hydroxy-L-aspartate ammonia-lyase n=1 Tax=Orrella daihaiensis TaxID=2782176 RepID=A0ABY4AM29_9BURK|nr:threo-3-hydroxy-L-aspartate ammonia-lyase [Orrella daihaiensis]UOD51327.1 threo-3-hydroxy-L-aspartate ammonia-lyase [Orrella daihaiensis]
MPSSPPNIEQSSLPNYAGVERASRTLAGVAHRTPVLNSNSLNQALGAEVFFKCEPMQRTGAFKFRGAFNALSNLTSDERAAGVVAYSSGNHAQAIAASGQILGVSTTIVMPHDAPTAKRAATEGYGAKIVAYDRYTENRDEIAADLAKRHGYTVIPPFNHPDVICGQGTAGKELFEDVGQLDALLVCLGGGGLLSGCALAASVLSPNCKVYGVEPEAGDDVRQSLQAGKIVSIPTPKSIADGAVTSAPGEMTFALMRQYVTDILTVSDAQLVLAMRWFAQRLKLVVEPTGCLAAAAVLQRVLPIEPGMRIGVIVSGGNVDLASYGAFLSDPKWDTGPWIASK